MIIQYSQMVMGQMSMTEIIKNNEQVHKAEKEIKYLFLRVKIQINLLLLFRALQMQEDSNIGT